MRPIVKKLTLLISSAILSSAALSTPVLAETPIFVNEIHYNDKGADAGEAIEIYGPAGSDTSGWTLALYNGTKSRRNVYNTLHLPKTIPASGFAVIPAKGLQNGDPDGFALVDGSGKVVQFLSYGGTFVAKSGPAKGMTSTDIGVKESGRTPDGYSLQLKGKGAVYEDFTWASAAENTFGKVNTDQTLGSVTPPPPPPSSLNCGEPATLISAIQGSGDTSPLVGKTETIEAVVVGDFQEDKSFKGFYVEQQEAQQDSDPKTSEGLFVASQTPVNLGDVVRVKGVVKESYKLTSLDPVSAVKVCATGQSVKPTEISLPFSPDSNNAEWYEGMSVVIPQKLTVSENYNYSSYGEIVVSSAGRLMNPTNVAKPGAAAQAIKQANDENRLIIDDGLSVRFPETAPDLTADNTLRVGYSTTNVTGILSYGFNAYRIQPTQKINFVADDNPRTASPDLNQKGSLRVASFNVLNFFNGDGQGGGFPTPRGAESAVELKRQIDKTVPAILAINADVLGLMELENDGYDAYSAIAELVDALNKVAGEGTYAFVDPKTSTGKIGTDAITVGMIYKPAKVELIGDAAILDSSVDSNFIDTKNRPTLVQTVLDLASNKKLTIAVNHLKSKGSNCNSLGDADQNDGQGNCNVTRTKAATALANWLAKDPTNADTDNVLIIGDLNAYAMEDPITALKDNGFTNLIAKKLGDKAYSYVYKAEAGYLDHALASQTLTKQVTDLAEWHINADEPRALDYNTDYRIGRKQYYKTPAQLKSLYNADAYRSSDHDPVVVEMFVPGDLNNDGVVNGADFMAFRTTLGKCTDSTHFIAEADYNNNGCIDRDDYNTWYRNYKISSRKSR